MKHNSGSWAFALSKEEYKSGQVQNSTNSRMEIEAILQAIIYIKVKYPYEPITIYSDSKYCVDGFNKWMHSWHADGWVRDRGREIANLDQWKKMYAWKDYVELVWVKAHADNEMNNFVDSLCINY